MRFLNACAFLFLLVMLAGCLGGGTPRPVDFHSGIEGITIEFAEGFPPVELYEEEFFPVVIELENNGADDVPFDNVWLFFLYDPLYIRTEVQEFTIDRTDDFHGRSEFYPDGEFEMIELYNFQTKKVVGLRQMPKTNFGAQLCYEYKTTFAHEVCVDVDRVLRTGRPQVCEGQDLSSSGQGAPIAFTHVEVRNNIVSTSGGNPFVRPEYVATIRNLGTGMVVSPPRSDFVGACRMQDIPFGELNAVRVRAELLGLELDCHPQLVNLRDGEGQTRCRVKDADVTAPALLVQNNILTPIIFEAEYIYRDTAMTSITIENTPGVLDDSFTREGGILKGYAYDSNGNMIVDSLGPLTLCRQYAHDPGSAPNPMMRDRMDVTFACGCEVNACQKLDDDGFCFYSICPGYGECCSIPAYEIWKREQEEAARLAEREAALAEAAAAEESE